MPFPDFSEKIAGLHSVETRAGQCVGFTLHFFLICTLDIAFDGKL